MAPHHGLVHTKEYDIKDSNVELIGSDMDHRVKYASAATEPAWNDGIVGKQPGLYVWRVEDFQVVAVPKAKYGLFYDGDSYIVLHSVSIKDDKPLLHDIFFWLGAHTSQDEAGVAAYKTVELDEFLHGAATQHREVQANPSPSFLRLFRPQLTIRRGGVASGFQHVEDEDRKKKQQEPLLLRIFKHPDQPRAADVVVHEVIPTWKSLDDDDVFVYDDGRAVYVWQGRGCSPHEKAKAAEVAQAQLAPVHTGGVQVLSQQSGQGGIVVRLLGGSDDQVSQAHFHCPRPVHHASSHRSPTAPSSSSSSSSPSRLWKLSDASGKLTFELVKKGPASPSDLDSDDVFLWDEAGRAIWVWEGRGASKAERSQWLRVAQAYVRQLNKERGSDDDDDDDEAAFTPVAKVREGSEPEAFLQSLQTASVH